MSSCPLLLAALALATVKPVVIQYDDPQFDGPLTVCDAKDYEALIAQGDPDFAWLMPEDEWDAISINYTSGTTGDPKGVVSHHRGAYLLAQGNALTASMPKHAVYLWTLPMFHCNGWCFPWTLSAIIGTHVCLRQVRAEPIWNALADENVTHLCGAPIVMSLMISAPDAIKRDLDRTVQFFTAAAPPPEKLLAEMKTAGFEVTHLYGLTETYGPAVVNDWHESWSALPPERQAALKSRQGVRYLPLEQLDVLDPETMHLCRAMENDGRSHVPRQRRDEGLFSQSARHHGGLCWRMVPLRRSGVVHPDGYIQLKDRSKDVIISGGENISSIEVEEALYRHPAVAVAAVVAMPHEKWGETPCAFIELVSSQDIDAATLKDWCRKELAGYKVPSRFVFMDIPRTSTGKIQKFVLRDYAKAHASDAAS